MAAIVADKRTLMRRSPSANGRHQEIRTLPVSAAAGERLTHPRTRTNPAGGSLIAPAGTGRTHICIVIAGDS
jgi:hypothetical protein